MAQWALEAPFAVLAVVFVFFYVQYLFFAGGAYGWVWIWGKERFASARVQRKPRPAQPRRELIHSTTSILVISALIAAVMWAAAHGYSLMYFEVEEYGGLWIVLSVLVMALVHDSYYYWAHRFMHHPKVFRHVHKLHHRFSNPTPFASYAFHPLEAIVEVAWFAPLAFIFPMHPFAVALYIVVLTVLNVISHLGYEFYRPRFARWFITSTHHNMHHSRGKGHFMLYFNWWDQWMGTNQHDYEAEVELIYRRRHQIGAKNDDSMIEGEEIGARA